MSNFFVNLAFLVSYMVDRSVRKIKREIFKTGLHSNFFLGFFFCIRSFIRFIYFQIQNFTVIP